MNPKNISRNNMRFWFWADIAVVGLVWETIRILRLVRRMRRFETGKVEVDHRKHQGPHR